MMMSLPVTIFNFVNKKKKKMQILFFFFFSARVKAFESVIFFLPAGQNVSEAEKPNKPP